MVATAEDIERAGDETSSAISIRSVMKSFGSIRAVRGVSFDVAGGSVHALVGANGAGKSTLLSILAGRTKPDGGEVWIHGRQTHFDTPRQARHAGICSVYQELTIVPALSAKANVFIGQEAARLGFLTERLMDEGFGTLCRRMRVAIEPDAIARRLSLADQQALEIMRGLASHARIMLFDEPTTALAPAERDALFAAIRGLRDEGVTILLVSHNLEEVLDISDAVTVFRDGRLVATRPRAAWTKRQLIHAMIGRNLAETEAVHLPRPPNRSKTVLGVRAVNVPGALHEAKLDIRAGEIVGIGGLVGSGRTTLLRALAGLETKSSGEMMIDGVVVPWPKTPRRAIDYGIGLVPEDRKTQGLVGAMSALDNLTLADLSRASRLGFILEARRKEISQTVARSFGFDPSRLDTPVRTLSGGNQQKVLLARWGYKVPRVLLIDEPTRGIDVGAKDEILTTIRALADQGLAIIVVSSEIEEIVRTSDRVIVLSAGQIVGDLAADRSFDASDVMAAAFGEQQE